MKKVLKVFCFLSIIFLVTGCLDYKIKMDVKSDKSVAFNIGMKLDLFEMAKLMMQNETIMGSLNQFDDQDCEAKCPYDKSSNEYKDCINKCMNNQNKYKENPTDEEVKKFIEENLMDEDIDDEFFSKDSMEELEKMGYTATSKIDEQNYTVNIEVSKQFPNIDEISSNDEKKINLNDFIEGKPSEKLFIKTSNNTYKSKFTLDYNNEEMDEISSIDIDLKDILTFTYEINLPNKNISNNATKVTNDGKTLIWDLSVNTKNDIEFEFDFNPPKKLNKINSLISSINKDMILPLGLIAGGSLTFIISLIGLIISNKNSKKEN